MCQRLPTDLCVRPGFMLFMLGCMGTFPCGSFCLFFWWRSRRRRPSSSHHDDSRAARKTHTHIHTHTRYHSPPLGTHNLPAWRWVSTSARLRFSMCEWSQRKQLDFVVFEFTRNTVFFLLNVSLKWIDLPCQVSEQCSTVNNMPVSRSIQPEVIAKASRGQPNSINLHWLFFPVWISQQLHHTISTCTVKYIKWNRCTAQRTSQLFYHREWEAEMERERKTDKSDWGYRYDLCRK